jgi:hypothetical protein
VNKVKRVWRAGPIFGLGGPADGWRFTVYGLLMQETCVAVANPNAFESELLSVSEADLGTTEPLNLDDLVLSLL